jgi:hypothetical protein
VTRRPLTGIQTAWLATAALLTTWYGTWGAIAATVRWPGLTLIIGGSAYLAHRTTTQPHPTPARKAP